MSGKRFWATRGAGRSGGGGGFTLVELLVVIAIIVAVVGIVVVGVNKARARADRAAMQTQIVGLSVACEAYKRDFGMYPPSTPGGTVQGPEDYTSLTNGGQMLAQALLGWMDYAVDGAGPSHGETEFGFRTRKGGIGSVFGPYADAKMWGGKTANKTNSMWACFLDSNGNAIYYYAAVPAAGRTVNSVFGDGTTSVFVTTHNSHLNLSGSADFMKMLGTDGTNTISGASSVPQGDKFLLVGAGVDGKYGTADDVVNEVK